MSCFVYFIYSCEHNQVVSTQSADYNIFSSYYLSPLGANRLFSQLPRVTPSSAINIFIIIIIYFAQYSTVQTTIQYSSIIQIRGAYTNNNNIYASFNRDNRFRQSERCDLRFPCLVEYNLNGFLLVPQQYIVDTFKPNFLLCVFSYKEMIIWKYGRCIMGNLQYQIIIWHNRVSISWFESYVSIVCVCSHRYRNSDVIEKYHHDYKMQIDEQWVLPSFCRV